MITGELDSRKKRLLLELKSEITSTQIQVLKHELAYQLNRFGYEGWDSAYFDLRAARLIDSLGLNWLFSEFEAMKGHKKEVVVRISSPAINRVFQFTGIDRHVTVKFRRRRQIR